MVKCSLFLSMVGVVAAVTACDWPGDSRNEVVVGIIEWRADAGAESSLVSVEGHLMVHSLDEPALHAPDTVQAGVPFEATVTTIGASGCWRVESVQTKLTSLEATITPYDRVLTRHPDGGVMMCTGALVRLSRSVELTFHTPGDATIRVEGRVVLDGDLDRAEPTSLARQVIVR